MSRSNTDRGKFLPKHLTPPQNRYILADNYRRYNVRYMEDQRFNILALSLIHFNKFCKENSGCLKLDIFVKVWCTKKADIVKSVSKIQPTCSHKATMDRHLHQLYKYIFHNAPWRAHTKTETCVQPCWTYNMYTIIHARGSAKYGIPSSKIFFIYFCNRLSEQLHNTGCDVVWGTQHQRQQAQWFAADHGPVLCSCSVLE